MLFIINYSHPPFKMRKIIAFYAVTCSIQHNSPMSNKASNWHETFATKLAKWILNNAQTQMNEDLKRFE